MEVKRAQLHENQMEFALHQKEETVEICDDILYYIASMYSDL